MTCYYPRHGFRSRDGRNPVTGAWPIVFNVNDGYIDLPVTVPCGKCIGCRLEHSRQWAIRCIHESMLHKDNCFLTLTYNNDYLPSNNSLNVTDIQKFFKRLRKRIEIPIRYFQCGEYGELFQRPHHHVILFGYDFPDRKFAKLSKSGFPLYRSELLSDLWPFGFHDIGDVTFESAAYTARYILKKITGDIALEHYHGRMPEYVTMSRRPGIASGWLEKYYNDVYPHDYVVIRDGIKCRPPKYYDNIYDSLQEEYQIKDIKLNRIQKIKNKKDYNNEWRLHVQNQCHEIRAKSLVRHYELGEDNV